MTKVEIMPRPQNRSATASGRRSLWILCLLLAFPSTGFIQKHTGIAGVAGYLAAVVAVVFLSIRLTRLCTPWLERNFHKLALLAIAGLAVCFVVLHPFEDCRGPGKSSDRDEGLEMAVSRMAHGESPYYPSNPIAGPLSVLPGSIFLAAPFVALGNPGYQNVFWLGVFLFVARAFSGSAASALWMLIIPLGVSIAAMYEFVSGGDLLANGIFVTLFLLFALTSWSKETSPGWQRWTACVLVGIGLASRANFVLLMPLFGAAMWRIAGLRSAMAATTIATLSYLAVTLPFYLHDPAAFTPLMSRNKIASLDHSLPWASTVILGVTVLSALLGALWLLFRPVNETQVAFFRIGTVVTLVPMIATLLASSWLSGHPEFSIMRDRFGLMYVFLALLGWAGALQWSPATIHADSVTRSSRKSILPT